MTPVISKHFQLDTPEKQVLPPLSRFSGWYLTSPGQPVNLVLYLNGTPHVNLRHGSPRVDVAASFPQWPKAELSGFYGDVLLPAHAKKQGRIDLAIWDHGTGSPRCLYKQPFKIDSQTAEPSWRKRDFNLLDILACLDCGKDLTNQSDTWHCQSCGGTGPFRGQAHFFLKSQTWPLHLISERTHTHPNAEGSCRLLEKVGHGLILDFGSGNPPISSLRQRTCYLDIQQYAHTDVIINGDRLPFKDDSFDGVISQSVFEHLPDPFLSAKELFRVLKPGGHLYVDTAFMQPLHADPSHYFNMTKFGLRRVFHMFEEQHLDIAAHHLPSYGLMMQMDSILPQMREGTWKERFRELRDILGRENQELDRDLGPEGCEKIAAGWFFEGRKPTVGNP